MKKKLKLAYEDLSYSGKLKLVFYIIFFVIALTFIVLGILIARFLTAGVYDRNQEKLAVITYSMQNEMEQVQSLTTEINQNETFQLELVQANNSNYSSHENHKVRKDLQDELNWLLVNKQNIKNVLIYNTNLNRITGKLVDQNSAFQEVRIAEEVAKLPKDDRIGKWYFDKNMQEAIYVRNLFSTRESVNNRVGMMAIYLNMTFVQELLDESSIFSEKDYLVLKNDQQFSTTNSTLFQTHSKSFEVLQKAFSAAQGYRVESLNGLKYYVLQKDIQIGSHVFQLEYFLLNQQLIEKVIYMIFGYFIFVVLLLLLCFKVVNKFIARLVTPVNTLAKTMQKFKGEENLHELTKDLDFSRKDEIGVLNNNFNDLVSQIQDLIIKQYQAKMLNQEIEYKFLQAQLDPHFLYNTLNSINWMAINKDEEEISEMVTALAVLLRSKFDRKNEYHLIREELEIINAYLSIQSIRFKNRLHFIIDIDEVTLNYKIPQLIIQPLIENSVKYGVEKQNTPLNIQLTIEIEKHFLKITVCDDGPGFENRPPISKQSTGVGLKNIKNRISVIYGENAKMVITSKAYFETKVTIYLPIDKIIK